MSDLSIPSSLTLECSEPPFQCRLCSNPPPSSFVRRVVQPFSSASSSLASRSVSSQFSSSSSSSVSESVSSQFRSSSSSSSSSTSSSAPAKPEEKKGESKRPVQVSSSSAARVERLTQKQVDQMYVEKFTAICRDYEERLQKARSGDTSVLNSGCWTANDYFDLMQRFSERNNQHFIETGVYYHGLPPKGFLTLVDDFTSSTGKDPFVYVLKKGIKPSEALAAIQSQLCFIDPRMAYAIAQLEVIKEIGGVEAFDRYFSKHPLVFRTQMRSLVPFGRGIPSTQKRVGAIYGVRNHPDYVNREHNGEWASVNVTRIKANGHWKCIGFGLPSEGVTEKELFELMAKSFNQTPYNGRIVTPTIWQRLRLTRLFDNPEDFKDMQVTADDIVKCGGGFAKDVAAVILDVNKIYELIK